MNKPCFINATLFNFFKYEMLTKRDTVLGGVLKLFLMSDSNDKTIGFAVNIIIPLSADTYECRWHDTFDEALKFYTNYDIDLDKQK